MIVKDSVYKEYTTKSIFVWICIVLMCIGWILTIIQTKQKNIVDGIKNKVLGVGGYNEFYLLFKNYGGYMIFLGSWLGLCLIEALWKPYEILGLIDKNDLKKVVEKNK